LATLALPWYRTGATHRSALGVVAALRGAGMLSRLPAHVFVVAIALIPGLAAISWVLAFARCPRLSAGACVATGVLVAGSAFGVQIVGHSRADGGTTVALIAGLAAVVTGALALASFSSLSTIQPKGQP
jgi:hypothetical protein